MKMDHKKAKILALKKWKTGSFSISVFGSILAGTNTMLFRHFLLLCCFSIAASSGAQIPKGALSLWLSADSGVVSTASGVQEWKDRSGRGLHARTITSKAPALVPSGQNGRPTVRFNGVDNGMVTPPCATFPGKRGTVVVVTRCSGRSATSGVGYNNFIATYHGKRARAVWQFGTYEKNFSFYDGIGGRLTHAGSEVIGEWELLTLVRYDDSLMCLYRGGRRLHDFQVADVVPDTNSLKIGFNGKLSEDSIPEVLNGEIAEILVYDRVLDENELALVHGYLSQKWGLALASPPVWQRWWFYALLVTATVAITIWLTKRIAFQKLRKRLQKLEKQAAVEAERYRISRDMHDEIGSGLTHIALLSELIQTQQKRDEELQKDVGTISASARKLVESMSEIIWTLNPQNDTLENLLAYLREQTGRYFEPFALDYAIQFPDNLPPISLTDEERRNLFLTAKEALHNALKHSGATKVLLRIVYQESRVHFYIEDNGRGFDKAKARPGSNGLKIMERRMTDMGGGFAITTLPTGTVVHFYFLPHGLRAAAATTYFTSAGKKH
ncbi:MAG: hypothetical protein JWP69_2263 [Flaviaesturariibacter sp.]|nr:hypothetical protein [Flaviaesturariibacter sp.]